MPLEYLLFFANTSLEDKAIMAGSIIPVIAGFSIVAASCYYGLRDSVNGNKKESNKEKRQEPPKNPSSEEYQQSF